MGVVDTFNQFQKSLVLQSSDLSLLSIADMVESQAIDISPKYQRRDRWGIDKQSALIESFLMNIPVPPIYLAEDETGTYSVIDGKQRITAIHQFMMKNLRLKQLERFTELENQSFSELPDILVNALKIRPYLRVVTLLRQSNPDVKHEVFIRLNKAGVALNSQEIRNVAFRGKFNDLLFELAENNFLRQRLNITNKSRKYSEMVDVQYVLRYFTVLEYWNDFPGNMDLAMDNFMERYHRVGVNKIDESRGKFLAAIDACRSIWGEEAFTKPGGTRKAIQGFFDIQMIGVTLLNDRERNRVISEAGRVRQAIADEITNNVDYDHSITQFTSNPERMRFRISKTIEILRGI